jgi:uncharacterized damage-inducible protein DinB
MAAMTHSPYVSLVRSSAALAVWGCYQQREISQVPRCAWNDSGLTQERHDRDQEATQTMATLSGDSLRDVGRRVFAEKSTTLNEAARDVSVTDFRETIRSIREGMREALRELPDSAFAEQPTGEGERVWSAGQVVAHVSNSFYLMSGQVRPLLDMPPSEQPAARDMEQHPSRTETLAILDQMDSDTEAFFDALPADGDYTKTGNHRFFGDIDTKGWLMVMSVHETDHLTQIRALGE